MLTIPFLDKNDPAQMVRFRRLMMDTDLLLLPTRADCFGLVFCEASAFGVPSISCDTGGVSSAIVPGRSGLLLPVDATADDFAAAIAALCADKSRFLALRQSSRAVYEMTHNWDAWAQAVKIVINSVIRDRVASRRADGVLAQHPTGSP